jgi:hypothetical protein
MSQDALILLRASVVDRLRGLAQNNTEMGCAWFFCDGKQMESPKAQSQYILGSLLRQLLEILITLKRPCLDVIKDLQTEVPNTVDSKVCGLFINTIATVSRSFTKYAIVIDGIDECPIRSRPEFCALLLKLASGNIKLLVTSRRENDICKVFGKLLHLEMTEDLVSSDKAIHLNWVFENDPQLKKIKLSDERHELKQQLLSRKTETYRP